MDDSKPESSPPIKDQTKPPKKQTKCEFCKKKSIILVICKCGLQTCLKHKDPETHCCVYDFKSDLEMGDKCELAKLIKINE